MAHKRYQPQLRIGDGPWFNAGMSRLYKSKSQAESVAQGFAKGWLGVAADRASEVNLNNEESNPCTTGTTKEETACGA